MVKLKNIRRTERTIEADFYPEGDIEAGHMVVNLSTGEAIESVTPEAYRGFTYASHTKTALLELAQEEELPETYTVMWY